MNELKLRELLKKYKNINFSIRDLLIDCGEEEIQGLIYYYSKEARKIIVKIMKSNKRIM